MSSASSFWRNVFSDTSRSDSSHHYNRDESSRAKKTSGFPEICLLLFFLYIGRTVIFPDSNIPPLISIALMPIVCSLFCYPQALSRGEAAFDKIIGIHLDHDRECAYNSFLMASYISSMK